MITIEGSVDSSTWVPVPFLRAESLGWLRLGETATVNTGLEGLPSTPHRSPLPGNIALHAWRFVG